MNGNVVTTRIRPVHAAIAAKVKLRSSALRAVLRLGVATGVAVTFSMPMLWMITSSLKPRDQIFEDTRRVGWRTLLPLTMSTENYRLLFADHDFARVMLNSIAVAIATSLGAVLVSSMAGYALGRLKFRGRGLVSLAFLLVLLVPFEVIMIPLFLQVQRMGLADSYLALVVPWLADPLLIFLLASGFKSLPTSIEEAAFIDGASRWRIYWSIALPNIRPFLLTAAFMKFFFSWDAYVWPLIVIQDPNRTVIPVATAKLFSEQDVLWGQVFASSTLATLPLVAIFMFIQRYYVASIVNSGLK